MIVLAIALAVFALGAMAAAGWMLGARAGRASRVRLAYEMAAAETRATAATARLEEVTARAERCDRELAETRDELATALAQSRELNAKLAASQRAVESAELAARNARSVLAQANARHTAQIAEIADLRARLDAARGAGHQQEAHAVAEMQRMLAPLIERERLASELARIDVGRGTRGELPQLMDALAHIGGFSSVVLSDDVGLPLAVSSDAEDGELLAGLWSILLAVADRVTASGAPAPHAIVVHDAANQTLVHRLFTSAGSRFVLTTVSRGRSLPPEVLDPALGKLERILAGTPLDFRMAAAS